MTLIDTVYTDPDYADRFAIEVAPGRFATVDDVATSWFTRQPAWIRLLSTNSLLRGGVIAACRDNGYAPGTSVGSWEVIDRSDDEIVFGDHLGFMEFRTSFRLRPGCTHDNLEARTVVRYVWRRTGRFYFALVRPAHRRFMRFLLRTTAAA